MKRERGKRFEVRDWGEKKRRRVEIRGMKKRGFGGEVMSAPPATDEACMRQEIWGEMDAR